MPWNYSHTQRKNTDRRKIHKKAFNQQRPSVLQKGFTLVELLVAVLLLAMVSSMIYSILNVGVKFSNKGETQLLATERSRGFLALLRQQVNSAWYNNKMKKIEISSDEDMLRIITRRPFLYQTVGVVLAIYRYNDDEGIVYYTEKKDFFNIDYDEEYVPDFDEMLPLLQTDHDLIMEYDPETGEVIVQYEDKKYIFMPKCWDGKS